MSPGQLYERYLKAYGLSPDPAQQRVLAEFDVLHHALQRPRPWAVRLGLRRPASVQGIYLWGGVGRGKTLLMDLLYESLTGCERQRNHFHQFMRRIHDRLKTFKHRRDPLQYVAAGIAGETRVLCLDEFYVASITDAMLLARLLDALFRHRVTLVTTSNIHPDDLYAGGLQRARFLPAIELIKQHTHVLELEGDTDYRLKTLRKDGTYHYPADDRARRSMQDAFDAVSSHAETTAEPVKLNGRAIPVVRRTDGVIWFDFDTLCNTPRSQDDYLEIAREFHSVFISDLPPLDDRTNDAARRLLNLLDVFYDARVKLIVSADAPMEKIYSGEMLAFEFQRASSRLIEMQSETYLSQTHRG